MANYTMPVFQTTYSDDNTGGVITGNSSANTIYGNGGVDIIYGGGGNDTLRGGTEGDQLIGDAGDDSLYGEDGDDVFWFYGSAGGSDLVSGGAGYDTIKASAHDTIIGLRSLDGVELITANGYNNVSFNFVMDSAYYTFDLAPMQMTGITSINFSGIGVLQLYTTDKSEIIQGGAYDNTIFARGGNDIVYGANNFDDLVGGDGNDALYGYGAADALYGEGGADILYGGAAGDYLSGGACRAVPTMTGSMARTGRIRWTAARATISSMAGPATTISISALATMASTPSMAARAPATTSWRPPTTPCSA